MIEIVEEEYERFLLEMQESKGTMGCGSYIDESDYEDEYSHNDIEEAQTMFIKKVEEYLHENYPCQYIVSCGWCVFVMTPESARERNVFESTIEMCIVK